MANQTTLKSTLVTKRLNTEVVTNQIYIDTTVTPLTSGDNYDLFDLPKGCSFCDRCPDAKNICYTNKPPLFNFFENDHRVACWLYKKKIKKLKN